MRRPDSDETRMITIPFEQILVPSMFWRMLPNEPQLGYIHVTSFTARTPDELESAYNELLDQGMHRISA